MNEECATEEAIKQTHRRLVLLHHPDKNPSKENVEHEEPFTKIKEAYEVLTKQSNDNSLNDVCVFESPHERPGSIEKPIKDLTVNIDRQNQQSPHLRRVSPLLICRS